MAEVLCLFRFVLVREIQQDFVGVFNKTIIPLTLVGYEMIIANSYPMPPSGIIVKYIIATAHDLFRFWSICSGLDPVSIKGIDKQF